jgi:hypothetical protein
MSSTPFAVAFRIEDAARLEDRQLDFGIHDRRGARTRSDRHGLGIIEMDVVGVEQQPVPSLLAFGVNLEGQLEVLGEILDVDRRVDDLLLVDRHVEAEVGQPEVRRERPRPRGLPRPRRRAEASRPAMRHGQPLRSVMGRVA